MTLLSVDADEQSPEQVKENGDLDGPRLGVAGVVASPWLRRVRSDQLETDAQVMEMPDALRAWVQQVVGPDALDELEDWEYEQLLVNLIYDLLGEVTTRSTTSTTPYSEQRAAILTLLADVAGPRGLEVAEIARVLIARRRTD